MESGWKKVKHAFGLNNLCFYPPRRVLGDAPSCSPSEQKGKLRSYGSDSVSTVSDFKSTSTAMLLSKHSSRSSKKTCIICLGMMKPGHGHALFTAECSHTFHFHCIVSNVKHGNNVCPVCRANWKEIPFQAPLTHDLPHGRPSRVNPVNLPPGDGQMTILRRLPRVNSAGRQPALSTFFHISEPTSFNDDESLEVQPEPAKCTDHACSKIVDVRTYTEVSAVQQSVSRGNFTILISLKAPWTYPRPLFGESIPATILVSQGSRAPVDLVTVLDISGSMAGTKLALLKRAMGFVIQNLGPSDRLSVIAFSSTARRLFHLRLMNEAGRQQALQDVNSLAASGGTNIAEGLKKATKVIDERRERNPVCSIILLSDGQDTYTLSSPGTTGRSNSGADYSSLLPTSVRNKGHHHTPVHAFGFGSDHDSNSMHSISETSGGTFSFIETESVIQDAFAQCIGGLLSVVVQDAHVSVECVHPDVRINFIQSGSYVKDVKASRTEGSVRLGDLYADEERDFLVSVNVPAVTSLTKDEDTVLLTVGCLYRDPVTNEMFHVKSQDVSIRRPEAEVCEVSSIEVVRQRNRLQAAEAMAEARAAAEEGLFTEAISILENCRQLLTASPAWSVRDNLSVALYAELKEMQERMTSRQRYEASGRAFVLSGLSSHSWQRATARGDSTDFNSLVHSYQTPSMVDMLQRSQTMISTTRCPNPRIQPTRSLQHRASR